MNNLKTGHRKTILRVNIAFLILVMPYLAVRRVFRVFFGRLKNYEIFLAAGLASTTDYLEKIKIPELVRTWIDVRSRFGFEKEVVITALAIRGNLFLDVGSDDGYYSVLLSRNFDAITAFEPNPASFRRLNLTIAAGKLRNVTPLDESVSDHDGTAILYVKTVRGRHSLEFSEPVFAHDLGGTEVRTVTSLPVRTVKLDSLVKQTVDLVKVDVEGAEWRVIHGAEASIETGRILRWIIEVHDKGARKGFENYLQAKNYDTRWLSDRHLFASLRPR